MNKVPLGLKILAVINIFFAITIAIGFIATRFSPEVRHEAVTAFSIYAMLSPTITVILLAVSAVGYLKRHYVAGFVTGVACSVFSICNTIVYNAMRGFTGFAFYVPSMIYPLVTLLLLTLKYRRCFTKTGAIDNR